MYRNLKEPVTVRENPNPKEITRKQKRKKIEESSEDTKAIIRRRRHLESILFSSVDRYSRKKTGTGISVSNPTRASLFLIIAHKRLGKTEREEGETRVMAD